LLKNSNYDFKNFTSICSKEKPTTQQNEGNASKKEFERGEERRFQRILDTSVVQMFSK